MRVSMGGVGISRRRVWIGGRRLLDASKLSRFVNFIWKREQVCTVYCVLCTHLAGTGPSTAQSRTSLLVGPTASSLERTGTDRTFDVGTGIGVGS